MAAVASSKTLFSRSVFLILGRQPTSVLQTSAILSLFRVAFGEIDHYHSTRFQNDPLDCRASVIFRETAAADRLRQMKHMHCRLQTGPGYDGDELVRAELIDERLGPIAALETSSGRARARAIASTTRRRPVPRSEPVPAANQDAAAPQSDAMARLLGAIVDPDGSSTRNVSRYSRPSRSPLYTLSDPNPAGDPHGAGQTPPGHGSTPTRSFSTTATPSAPRRGRTGERDPEYLSPYPWPEPVIEFSIKAHQNSYNVRAAIVRNSEWATYTPSLRTPAARHLLSVVPNPGMADLDWRKVTKPSRVARQEIADVGGEPGVWAWFEEAQRRA